MFQKFRSWRVSLAAALFAAATLTGLFTACQTGGGGGGERVVPRRVHTQDDEALRRQRVQETFHLAVLARMEQAIGRTISDDRIPGGVLWIERNGVPFESAYGFRSLVPIREKMTRDTIFDIASLTKVVATTPAIMKLVEQRRIDLDDIAQKYIPEFKGNDKEKITIRQLLTHTSGLRPDISTRPEWSGYDTAIKMASVEKTYHAPDTDFRYSDINFFILSEVVRRVDGVPFEEFVVREFYEPLGMKDTGFKPDASLLPRIAPTEPIKGEMLRGIVHDPTARYMGGVAGHAGLFSTVDDLARYCRMLLNKGELAGVRVLEASTVELMTSVQSPDGVPERRGLGWDIDSGYSRPRGMFFPIGSYGHTGFTGTSLWIDPFSRTFWILLTNRLHPDGRGNVLPLQAELADLAAQAVKDVDFTAVRGALPPREVTRNRPVRTDKASVLNGIDVLVKNDFKELRGLKVGLITNHTGRDREGTPTIDLLHHAPEVELVALFSPEHGIRGELDSNVDDGKDAKTGLPIYSLYGERRSPLPEQLEGLDALVFDIQDIGCRFYTYISTMGNCMQVAAKTGTRFIVLDRLNPITGSIVAGPVLSGPTDFVGWHQLPVRHGMTVGELAQLFNAEKNINVELQVVRLDGWMRDLWLDETTIPWVNTSPNMRSLTQATLYPGVGLLEMNHLSVGRGTGTPFELFGAPYVDGKLLAERMNGFGIRGVRFDPIEFTPDASKFSGERCEGVRITLFNRSDCDVINIGIAGALVLNELYPEQFGVERFARLLKNDSVLDAIKAGRSLVSIRRMWEPALKEFQRTRQPHLLYVESSD